MLPAQSQGCSSIETLIEVSKGDCHAHYVVRMLDSIWHVSSRPHNRGVVVLEHVREGLCNLPSPQQTAYQP